jgi:hypothetical protein
MEASGHTAQLTPEQARRRRRVILELLWACTAFLLPWSIHLMVSLPRAYDSRHYDLAWAGFDVLELLALGATAYLGWRRRKAVVGAAIAAATLLVCDAWFDIALDLGTPGIWSSLAAAVFVELPLAAFLAHRARQLMQLTLLRLFPEPDGPDRPFRLTRVPLLLPAGLLQDQPDDASADVPSAEQPEPATRPEIEPGNPT